MAALGGLCTLLIVHSWKVTAAVYPAYIVIVNASQAAIILLRAKYVKSGMPSELRDL
jgi:hypothetical protein